MGFFLSGVIVFWFVFFSCQGLVFFGLCFFLSGVSVFFMFVFHVRG